MADTSLILGVLGILATSASGLGGYVLAGRNEEERDKRQAKREKDARDAERTARLRDRNHDFQREVLLGLQDQGRKLVRSSFHVIARDIETLEEKGQMFRLPSELDQEAYSAGIAYLQAMNRVTDDELRHHLRKCYEHATGYMGGALPALLKDEKPDVAIAKLEQARTELLGLYTKASEALGAVLRKELGREN